MKILLLNDYDQRVRVGDVVGTVTTQWGNPALRHGWKIIEIDDGSDKDRRMLVQGEVHSAMGGGFIVVLRRISSEGRSPICPGRSSVMGRHVFA